MAGRLVRPGRHPGREWVFLQRERSGGCRAAPATEAAAASATACCLQLRERQAQLAARLDATMDAAVAARVAHLAQTAARVGGVSCCRCCCCRHCCCSCCCCRCCCRNTPSRASAAVRCLNPKPWVHSSCARGMLSATASTPESAAQPLPPWQLLQTPLPGLLWLSGALHPPGHRHGFQLLPHPLLRGSMSGAR